MRGARILVASATAALTMLAGAAVMAGPPPSTEPPASEPTTTTTEPTPTSSATTVPAPTTVQATTTSMLMPTTTARSTPTTSTSPSGPLGTASATADCIAGARVIAVEIIALQDTTGGDVRVYGFGDAGDQYYERSPRLPGLVAGQAFDVFLPVPASPTVEVQVTIEHVSLDINGNEVGPIEELISGNIEVPPCPLPPTAPSLTAEVTRCAGRDSGGAIEVTVTNPSGGPEFDPNFMLVRARGQEVYWSGIEQSPEDGEQAVVIVEEANRDDSTDELAAGEYVVTPSWVVDIPGAAWSESVIGESVSVTMPECGLTEFRVATFNASLNRASEGELVADLSTTDDPQAVAVAEIIQRTRPDILLINEFDYDASGQAVELFLDNYLAVAQGGAEPIEYPYSFTAPVNTGVASGFDLDRDGVVGGPGDALGFGEFPGQYGMVVLSRYPIVTERARTFQHLLWSAMPGARLPDDPATPEPGDWYSPESQALLPLSSKSHWDVPIDVDGRLVHVLASHPTPPTFDGAERRNGLRNADEIRFWADYIAGADTSWIVDDAGVAGGLAADAEFVVVGDLNSDPVDGDSVSGAMRQLLDVDRVQDPAPASEGGPEAAQLQGGANATHEGDPALDTADFADDPGPGNLRVDYVLPSNGLEILDANVFWPPTTDPLSALVAGNPPASSDHRLVWVDLR